MSWAVTGAQLLELLDEAVPSRAELLRLVDRWAEDFDRGDRVDPDDGCNMMHMVGAALCVLLHRSEPGADFDLRAALGPAAARVVFCEKALADYDVEELQNLVSALQLEFATLYTLEECDALGGYAPECDAPECGRDAGLGAIVDTEAICVRIMAQLGSLLAVREFAPRDSPPPAAVRGLLEVDAEGACSVRTETFVFMLDALHSMFCLHAMLTRASFLPPASELPELHAHHREASSETFFTHSITSDCVVGTVAQYAHRFAHLFHSVSQVIYYNHPSYARQTQLPLAELERANACAVNVLPLLTELRPDIPVLFEHTGAGCRQQHAKHPWSWVLWSRFVLLVDADMRSYVAADLRTLLCRAGEAKA